jgi:hypothetical protein
LNRLWSNVLFANNVIVSGLLYVPSSWSSIALIDMLVFHLVRVGTFDTLNWLATFSSSMQKHACWMFTYDFHLFCACANMELAILIWAGIAN